MRWSFVVTSRGTQTRVYWVPFALFLCILPAPFLPGPWDGLVALAAMAPASFAFTCWFFGTPQWQGRRGRR
jgi:hypothetical protein